MTEKNVSSNWQDLQQLIDAMQDFIFIVDRQGIILHSNQPVEQYLGYSSQELINQHFSILHDPAQHRAVQMAFLEALQGIADVSTLPFQAKDGRSISVKTRITPAKWQGQDVACYVSRDISQLKATEEALNNLNNEFEARLEDRNLSLVAEIYSRQQTEDSLSYRFEMEGLIARLSKKFITISPWETDAEIENALAAIGEYISVDRAYIFTFSPGYETMSNVYEWCADGVEPRKDTLQDVPCDIFPWWVEKLKNQETIHIPMVDEMPPEAESEKNILQPQGIKSLVVVPLLVKGVLEGYIGYNSIRSPKEWSDEDINMLQVSGEILANALQHKQDDHKIRTQMHRMAALHEVDLAIISKPELDNVLPIIAKQATIELQVDTVCITLVNPLTYASEYFTGSGYHAEFVSRTRLKENKGFIKRLKEGERIFEIIDLGRSAETYEMKPLMLASGFSAYFAAPLVRKGKINGLFEVFCREPFKPDQDWFAFLQSLALQTSVAIDNATLFSGLQKANRELIETYDKTLEGWAHALDLRDNETSGHTRRVVEITLNIAHRLEVPENQIEHLRRGATLHDIGKMGIPDSILLKNGPLSEEEWVLMRKHPTFARDMLWPIEFLRPALEIPCSHHERWDGKGYPQGLKGEDIPLAARIFSLVDVWDALCSDRPYHKAWKKEDVLDYIREKLGSQFDPQIGQVFIDLMVDSD